MTDEELLHRALQGGETEWEELHILCSDRSVAARLGKALAPSAAQGVVEAAAWAKVLEQMHPGLNVKWQATSTVPLGGE